MELEIVMEDQEQGVVLPHQELVLVVKVMTAEKMVMDTQVAVAVKAQQAAMDRAMAMVVLAVLV
jgi:hypothetical protein